MRLILNINYSWIALAEDADANAILKAFDGVQKVRQVGYGKKTVYVIDEPITEISLTIARSDQVITQQEQTRRETADTGNPPGDPE